MRIAFFAKNIPLPNHKENNIVLKLSKALTLAGLVVDVYYPKEIFPASLAKHSNRLNVLSSLGKRFIAEGVQIHCIRYLRLFYFRNLEWVFTRVPFIKKNMLDNVDVIHSHFVFPDLLLAHNMNVDKKPLVVTVRQGDFNNIDKSIVNKFLFERYLNKSSAVIALTPIIYNQLSEWLDDKTKLYLVPNFIDDDYFSYPFPSVSLSCSTKLRVICISNMIKRKNIDWLIEAHNLLKGGFELTIVGDGPEYNSLKALSKHNVNFTGKIGKADVINQLDSNDLFILPSDKETFGLVYAEAMSRGLPVVCKKGTAFDGYDHPGIHTVESQADLLSLLNDYTNRTREKIINQDVINFASRFRKSEVVSKHFDIYKDLL